MPKGAKYGGRVKGTPNKSTASVKQALQEAFEGMGGVKALLRWGETEKAEFYKIWAKLIPTEVKIDPEGNKIIVEIVQFTQGQKP